MSSDWEFQPKCELSCHLASRNRTHMSLVKPAGAHHLVNSIVTLSLRDYSADVFCLLLVLKALCADQALDCPADTCEHAATQTSELQVCCLCALCSCLACAAVSSAAGLTTMPMRVTALVTSAQQQHVSPICLHV